MATSRAKCRTTISPLPLLIGGATTSRAHRREDRTALRQARSSTCPTLRECRRVSGLLSEQDRATYIAEAAPTTRLSVREHANKKQTPLVSLADARAPMALNGLQPLQAAGAQIHWPARVQEPRPRRRAARYIDWSPFFQTWDLAGPLPRHPR